LVDDGNRKANQTTIRNAGTNEDWQSAVRRRDKSLAASRGANIVGQSASNGTDDFGRTFVSDNGSHTGHDH
jgi:hypothetical protein